MKLRRLVENVWTYASWLAFALAAYVATYYTDPYVYGFTVLGLGPLSFIVALCGGIVWALGLRAQPRRMSHGIAVLSLLIASVTVVAYAVLANFQWA